MTSSTSKDIHPQFAMLDRQVKKNAVRQNWRRVLPVGAVLIVVIVSGLLVQGAVLNKAKPALQPTAAPVLTVSVQPASLQAIEREIKVNGSITAWDPISVGPQVTGLAVTSILVEEGASVKKGQVLATLDSSLLRPQLASAQAQLKASLASARKAFQPNRPEDINGLSAAVSQAQANVDDQQAALVQAEANLSDANSNMQRYEYLQKEGAVSAQELGTRRTTAKVALANVSSARQKIKAAKFSLTQAQERLAMARSGGRTEDIQIAAASVEQTRAEINRLQAQIEQTIIRAPVGGIITKRDVHIGDIAQPSKTMFSMARDHRLELRAQVPETDLKVLKPGQPVTIVSSLSGSEGISGRVREISPQIDSVTRLATVRIDIPTSFAVKPGMYAEGRIRIGKNAALTVPLQAVISDDDKSAVFVLQKNIVERRAITVGTRTNNQVEVISGLMPGDSIVVSGAGFLKDGDCVAVANLSRGTEQ